MKTLKVICIELVLAVFLTATAYAGDISTPGMTATPIPPTTQEMSDVSGTTDPASTTSGVLVPVDIILLLVTLVF